MRYKASVLLPAFVASLALFAASASAGPVIIKCGQSCDAVAAAITGHGGRITYRYRYVDAIAAELPNMAVAAVKGLVEPGAIRKDVVVALPAIAHDRDGAPMIASVAAVSADALSPSQIVAMASAHPNAYLINNTNMDLDGLLAAGYTGAGVTVAQIDSGVRPGFPNISLDGSVIGGEDLVGDGFGYSNTNNDGHGTFVAGMISANVIFTFSPSFVTAVSNYCPSCVINGNQIPMIGSAPSSSLYELRVFPPGQGAPSSRIMAAMERVLTLRENYDAGMPPTQNPDGSYDSLDIRVCNMSLGGPTMYAGRDLEDQLTQQFLDHDIVLVVSAANAGPSGSTTGSPGTGMGSLTVAASSDAVHERILRDLQYGNGVGALYRPFDGVQTAYFSSRGPTADGRIDPEITANGFASFGQGFGTPSSIDIGSGTSFSAPSVAGVAAVLRDAYPGATAKQIRDALIDSANPHILGDGSTPLDQGQGYVDAGAAATRLTSWMSGWHHDRDVRPSEQVWLNIWKGARVPTYMGWVSRKAKNLLPGQRMETYYYIPPFTSQVTITLSDVIPGADQNSFFGDDILFTVHSAKTSAIGEGDYLVYAYSTGGTWVIDDPEPGLMRVTVNGDWTNASPIGAKVQIKPGFTIEPGFTKTGKLETGDSMVVPFTVKNGATTLDVKLSWDADWGEYPTNDLDVTLIDPNGNPDYDAATINSPERATIANPTPGMWVAYVQGYSILTKHGERFKLRVAVDGKVVKH